jgi:hypothetical protein
VCEYKSDIKMDLMAEMSGVVHDSTDSEYLPAAGSSELLGFTHGK